MPTVLNTMRSVNQLKFALPLLCLMTCRNASEKTSIGNNRLASVFGLGQSRGFSEGPAGWSAAVCFCELNVS